MNEHLQLVQNPEISLEHSQSQLLINQLVQPNCDTQFGLQHAFSNIKAINDYRASVSLANYEDLRPWINKIVEGEQGVLTASRTIAFFKTSGSLSKPKYIPVTSELMRQKVSTFAAFWEKVYLDYPNVRHGKIVSNFADASDVELLESGMQVYAESSFWAKRGRALHSMNRWPLPKEMRGIKDPELRTYACARILLQQDMSCFMCLNPSTLLYFCRTIEKHLPELTAGLQSGDWGSDTFRAENKQHADVLNQLGVHLLPNIEAATTLSHCIASGTTPTLKALWPELDLVICWRSQVVRPFLNLLEKYVQDVPVRDYITQSSECMMAVPLEDSVSGGLLAHTAHFFEFIPEESTQLSQPETCLSWQLKTGSRYELVVTTGGGLYRYRTGDCVRVTGQNDNFPTIEFIYRLGKTSSMTGEKLTEYQVLIASQKATLVCQNGPEEFLCFPCSGDKPHYALALDFGQQLVTNTQLHSWALEFNQELKLINSEYADKCDSNRLGDLQIFRSSAGHMRHVRIRDRAPGVSEEQVKSEVLSSKLDLHIGKLQLDLVA